MKNREASWAAGFFEGEGCTRLQKGQYNASHIRVSIGQADPEVLERWLKFLEIDHHVNGPYAAGNKSQKNPKPRYVIGLTGVKAKLALSRMWPYLGPIKRAQAERAGFIP